MLGLAIALGLVGCGSNGDTSTSGTTDDNKTITPTTTGTGTGGAGGQGGVGGVGGQGGGGGAAPAAKGRSAGDLVSAGQVSKSPGYKMIYTLGQPSQNQGKMSSPKFRVQGGLVGASGSLP